MATEHVQNLSIISVVGERLDISIQILVGLKQLKRGLIASAPKFYFGREKNPAFFRKRKRNKFGSESINNFPLRFNVTAKTVVRSTLTERGLYEAPFLLMCFICLYFTAGPSLGLLFLILMIVIKKGLGCFEEN